MPDQKPTPDRKPDATSAATEMSAVKRALLEIRTLRARVEELESAQSESRPSSEREPIAIIGAGLRFPGGVVDEASFWNLLVQGKDAITEIPRERWDWRAYYDADPDAAGSMYTQHGGFLDGVDLFDAAFFGISPREAVAMDPQQRLALEVGWEALENAGYSPTAFQGSATGVFFGIANNDYGRSAMADVDRIDAYTGSGNSLGMVAGRLSYVLGLHGPSLVTDTACSSSLTAVHLACMSLRAGECSVALAGGANLILSPEPNVALSKAHMMARDGHCKTFDEAADGYVRGEGCCILVLKKLSDAISAGDRILAVIRGSAVNHDGRSGGLTAPNGPAQAAVMRRALEMAGVNAGEVGYVETHGTGTALGDPIEVETLAAVMGSERSSGNQLAIGSVKTNIGHTEAASGVAGLMKAVLALRHHEIPPSLHLNRKNPHIGWERISVVVPTEVSEWKPLNGHRYAGVSSFGFSGTNAHVVLEEAPEREIVRNPIERRKQILTISARTQSALDALCGKYVDALRACSEDGLADFCFTANTGRTHFAHRVAVVGETAEQMAMELERAGNGISSSQIFTGNAEDVAGEPVGCDQMPETLAALYVEGKKIDWNGFDKGYRRTRVALPTYPFERQRYWLASGDGDASQEIWRRSTGAALVQSKLVPIGLDVASLAAKQECLERWAVAEMLQTLRTLGAFAKPDTFYDAKSLAQSCGILPAHVKLMDRWLNHLCEAGYLDRDGSGYKNRAPLPDVDAGGAWRKVETELSGDPFLLDYLRNCSKHLQGVLRGTTSPLETLFPGGSPELARNLYENSVGPRYANLIVAAAVQAAVAAAPENRKLRILELGAGTGATTSTVLPTLPNGRVSYTFTDVSEVFLQGASRRFSQYPFVKYGLLDIEDEQQLAQHAGLFDIVIAANVVHATRDLGSTLSGIERLLTAGGTLVLLETTKNMAWHDITTGLIEGWQKSEDEIRGTKALVGVDDWNAALRHAGFEEVFAAPEAGSPVGDIGLHVILARGAADKEQPTLTKIAPQNAWVPLAGARMLSADDSAIAIDTLLRDAPAAEHRAILLDVVCDEIARVLRLPADARPKKQERLMDLGLDSLMAVELRDRIASRLGLESLPATLIFDYPTPDAIAGYLLDRVQQKTSQVSCPPQRRRPVAGDPGFAHLGHPGYLLDGVQEKPPVQEKMLTAEEVENLSEEDIAALLRSRLSR